MPQRETDDIGSSEWVSSPLDMKADVIIVGAGFSGCYALHRMRQLGLEAKIIEAGSDFGGVWHFNRYPGARVDSETPTYQFSLREVWAGFNFRERFPGQDELREYFSHVDKTWNLRKDATFNTRVEEARYDNEHRIWRMKTDSGLTTESRFVIFATGTTNKSYTPEISGLERFKGKVIHPCAWPEGLDVKGKKVGIIGQGASGLQIFQQLAKEDCALTVFVRTPCTAIPMKQRELSFEESETLKNFYDGLFEKAKFESTAAYPYNKNPKSFFDATEEERHQLFEQLWTRGGFGFLVSNYHDVMLDPKANAIMYDFWVSKVRSRMTDTVKKDIVAPLKQYQWIGTKRPNLETDYYEMLDRPNVKLVDLKATPIKELTPSGITTFGESDELHDLDVIIFATGYDSVTGSLHDMNIHDRKGIKLQDKWKDGIRTYLGMMIEDMPNAFLLYGPQAPTSVANGPPFIEMEVDWIAQLVQKARRDGVSSIEPTEEAVSNWRQSVMAAFEPTLYRYSTGWWTGMNIPGKNREPLIFFGGLEAWWERCNEALTDWSHFEVFIA
ncbi:hypothetical protein CkaCkLH20_05988 [Colletotrichum karsti]|uniref:Baeyer-Villiger monooxygenase n=1 Tax=Colletotrichum karsti TaxID=1095194 RepID=A0A9P6IDB5_9PEZI|nr:uncharacterized protein CkaCkLH20_05988 [Colletotrichum karsti]KAF9876580.1 hypothetical protein CkaCkLH20_05988 [Colletotrichum karsti]